MNRRALFGGFLVVVCLTTLWGVWRQRSQLAGLRAEQQQLLAQQAAREDGAASPGTAEVTGAGSGAPQPGLVVTPELLRLRNEVTRLTERRRELAGVRAENDALRARLTSRGTNGPGGLQLPPGYVRRSEARLVGYNSPDDTIQSLLWSIQSHDMTNLLQAFAPGRADQMLAEVARSGRSTEDYFHDARALPGMAILKREQLPDGSVELEVEIAPGLPPATIPMRQLGDQWKITAQFSF
jgi:hypothetical protein